MIHFGRKIRCGVKALMLIASAIWALGLQAETFGQAEDAGEKFIAGQHYAVLETPVATAAPESVVEVVEVFSYMCIHCYTFDPMLSTWHQAQSDTVDFVRLPAVFNPAWQLLAQAYYTAQSLGVEEEMHEPLFRAVHVERLDFRDEDAMAQLFQRHGGVDVDTFKKVFRAFSVKSRVMQSRGKSRSYGITGVPTMIVNGKYRVDAESAGGNVAMLKVVDFLVAKEQAANGD
jgi:thiol:disulfide interchange protein DsbA